MDDDEKLKKLEMLTGNESLKSFLKNFFSFGQVLTFLSNLNFIAIRFERNGYSKDSSEIFVFSIIENYYLKKKNSLVVHPEFSYPVLHAESRLPVDIFKYLKKQGYQDSKLVDIELIQRDYFEQIVEVKFESTFHSEKIMCSLRCKKQLHDKNENKETFEL